MKLNFEDMVKSEEQLCQLILDPTSLNLPIRVNMTDPSVPDLFKLSREFCFKIDKTRRGLLQQIEKKQNK